MLKLIQPQKVLLKSDPTISEKWIQDQIANDPSILGLGDLVLKDKERIQPKAGRLDLLLQDAESNRRYEVEIQLGKTDETHIIRTIEYWDIERKRYPQYDHCAVIIAEDITSRFLNVINLFNGTIPLIAIQMNAFRYQDGVSLIFTKILDEINQGLVEEDEEVTEITDREYWIKRGASDTVNMVDNCLHLIHNFDTTLELKYNKFYIGLAKEGAAYNFAIFRPRKKELNFELRLPLTEEIKNIIETQNIDYLGYDNRWGSYRLRITKNDLQTKSEIILNLLQKAYQYYNN